MEIEKNNYTSFDQFEGKKLWLKSLRRHNFKHGHYTLTDNIRDYGCIYFDSSFVRKTFFETNEATIVALNSTVGNLAIQTPEKKVIGYSENGLLTGKTTLKLNNGFKAQLKGAFFSSIYVWTDEDKVELFKVTALSTMEIAFIKPAKEIPNLNVLILVAVKNILNKDELVID